VRGPKHVVRKGKASVLTAEEMRALLDSVNTAKLIGLRDWALIALMGYTFARVGAVVQLEVADYYVQNRRGWVRLHEKGGKVNELPCHHSLESFLDEWLGTADRGAEPAAPLFPTMRDGKLTGRRTMARPEVYQMIRPARRTRDRDENFLPQLPGDRDHGLLAERREARSRATDGGA